MVGNITLGQYYPVDSVIHGLDPRTKILITLIFVALLFAVKDLAGYGILIVFTGLLVLLSKVPWRLVLRTLRPLIFILLFTFVLHVFMTKGEVLFTLGPLKGTREGVMQGIFIGLRLFLLIVTTSMLTLTTSPISLTDGLESLLGILSPLGVPAHELAMMMTIALRFVPTLLEEADKIMKAQMARGADFRSGSIMQRARSLIPLLVPLFVSAFRRADELATAMEARCYRGGKGRTRMKQLRFTVVDLVGAVVFAMFMVLSLGWSTIWARFTL